MKQGTQCTRLNDFRQIDSSEHDESPREGSVERGDVFCKNGPYFGKNWQKRSPPGPGPGGGHFSTTFSKKKGIFGKSSESVEPFISYRMIVEALGVRRSHARL